MPGHELGHGPPREPLRDAIEPPTVVASPGRIAIAQATVALIAARFGAKA